MNHFTTHPKLSIITVNLNNAIGLRKTIESVVSQTYADYEYLIIDGGSTDGSVEVIKEYAGKITYWVSEPDKGIYNAMNKGIQNATGEIVCFLNSGDLYVSKYSIEIVINEIAKSTAKLFFGNIIFIETKNRNIKLFNVESVRCRSDLLKNVFHQSSTFYSRDLFNEIGLFNTKYRIVSDADWYLNALINHKIGFSLINFNVSVWFGGGISTSNTENHGTEYNQMMSKYFTQVELRLFSGKTFNYLKENVIIRGIMYRLFHLKLNRI